MNKNHIIDKLPMTKHIEGGYFCETYRSEIIVDQMRGKPRSLGRVKSAAVLIYLCS